MTPDLAAALEPDWPISTDGPHAVTEHRRWLARQLMDSKLTEEEAYGIVRHSPAISSVSPTPESRGSGSSWDQSDRGSTGAGGEDVPSASGAFDRLKAAAEALAEVAPPEWYADMDRYALVGQPVGNVFIGAQSTLALCATGEWAPKLVTYLAHLPPREILALLSERERLVGERDEARAGLAYVLDHAEYGNSYGVHGSDFTCCHFCQGGGAPGVAMEHAPDCPVSRYPREVADWFEEMRANREDAEAAEARASTAEARVGVLEGALRKLWGAAADVLTGISLHNALAPDAPARRDDIAGSVVTDLRAATHSARLTLQLDTEQPALPGEEP